jgi:hypothetical protein
MAISTDTGNPMYRDRLAQQALDAARQGHVTPFIFPELAIQAETVDYHNAAIHELNLDALRGEDAEAKQVLFDEGAVASISVREYMQKSLLDKRRVEDYNRIGIDKITERGELHRGDILDIREFIGTAIASTAASFPAGHTVAGANFTAGNLPNLIEIGRTAIVNDGGYDISGMVIGPTSWRQMQANATFTTWLGAGRLPTLQAAAEYLNVPSIRVARYQRRIAQPNATPTSFWPVASALLFSSRPTLGTQTFGATPYVPYGAAHNRSGVMFDVRVVDTQRVEGLYEVAGAARLRTVAFNFNLGYLFTATV